MLNVGSDSQISRYVEEVVQRSGVEQTCFQTCHFSGAVALMWRVRFCLVIICHRGRVLVVHFSLFTCTAATSAPAPCWTSKHQGWCFLTRYTSTPLPLSVWSCRYLLQITSLPSCLLNITHLQILGLTEGWSVLSDFEKILPLLEQHKLFKALLGWLNVQCHKAETALFCWFSQDSRATIRCTAVY